MKKPIYTQPGAVCPTWQSSLKALLFLPLATLIWVGGLSAQCTSIACKQNVTVSLKDDCKGAVNSFFLLANPYACGGPTTIEYYDPNGNYIGDTLNASHLGMTLDAHLTHLWTGLSCTGSVKVVDGRSPEIDCENISLKCTEDYSPAALGGATATDNCSAVVSLTHEDEIIDLGCGMQGFQGYFEPSNWTVQTTNGDGGVDVTGAPDSVLVEGANASPFKVTPRYITRFKIVMPSEGYIRFDWRSFGGSNFNEDAFYVTINGVCIQLSFNDVQSGSWESWLLQPGDVLSFEQASDGNNDMVRTMISNFQFLTTAQKIIHRTWSATDEWGNTRTRLQVITLERATLADVFMPPNYDDLQLPALTCGANTHPDITGWPFLDEDQDPTTTADQFAIQNGDCTFSLTYEDQSVPTCEGSELLLREWTILNDCTGEILNEVQIIKLFDTTPPTLTCPPDWTVGTDSPECGVTVSFPPASATDDCAPSVDVLPKAGFGTGFGNFEDVPPGVYPILYTASDPCGNASSCTAILTVEDHHPPTVVCDGFTVASLTTDGTALVFADAIDDGSYDLCCLAGFDVKRKGLPDDAYAPFIEVDCGEVGTSFMVHMRATDCAGNSAICETEVKVEDQQAPALLAPADVT
ncbi:MAG: hypothetical protein D6714_19695, partial [Bacteroidetes bacterium]